MAWGFLVPRNLWRTSHSPASCRERQGWWREIGSAKSSSSRILPQTGHTWHQLCFFWGGGKGVQEFRRRVESFQCFFWGSQQFLGMDNTNPCTVLYVYIYIQLVQLYLSVKDAFVGFRPWHRGPFFFFGWTGHKLRKNLAEDCTSDLGQGDSSDGGQLSFWACQMPGEGHDFSHKFFLCLSCKIFCVRVTKAPFLCLASCKAEKRAQDIRHYEVSICV